MPPETFDSDPALAQVRVFETAFPLTVSLNNNTIFLHTWGNLECCLAEGHSHRLPLLSAPTGLANVRRSCLISPLAIFFCSKKSWVRQTGAKADADPTHRQVVQLEDVTTDARR